MEFVGNQKLYVETTDDSLPDQEVVLQCPVQDAERIVELQALVDSDHLSTPLPEADHASSQPTGGEEPVSRCPFTGATSAEAATKEPSEPTEDDSACPKVKEVPDASLADGPTTVLDIFRSGQNEHGSVFSLGPTGPGGSRAVVVAGPQALKDVLTSNNFADKGEQYKGLRAVLGDGLVSLNQAAWKDRRQLMNPSFRPESIRGMADTMTDVGRTFFDDLEERVGPEGAVVDMHEEMTTLTLETLVATTFGEDLKIMDRIAYQDILQILDTATALTGELEKVDDPSEMTGDIKERYDGLKATLNAATDHVIKTVRERGLPADGEEETLLSTMLKAKDAEADGPLDDESLRADMLALITAGHETTALTMSWMFALASKQPEVLKQLYEESDRVLDGRAPQLEDIPNMPFMRRVFDETLRMRPTVPIFARNTREDAIVDGHQLRQGDTVLAFIMGAHMDADSWPEPEVMDPDRFLPENSKGRHRSAYEPFSAGSRKCIGMDFGLQELMLHTSALLQRFDVQVDPDQSIEPEMSATLRTKEPVMARLVPRQRV